jgi:hypothetical protein
LYLRKRCDAGGEKYVTIRGGCSYPESASYSTPTRNIFNDDLLTKLFADSAREKYLRQRTRRSSSPAEWATIVQILYAIQTASQVRWIRSAVTYDV